MQEPGIASTLMLYHETFGRPLGRLLELTVLFLVWCLCTTVWERLGVKRLSAHKSEGSQESLGPRKSAQRPQQSCEFVGVDLQTLKRVQAQTAGEDNRRV